MILKPNHTLSEEQPRWIATRLMNRIVTEVTNYWLKDENTPSNLAWARAAKEAYRQLRPIQSLCLTRQEQFQNYDIVDQRDLRFVNYLNTHYPLRHQGFSFNWPPYLGPRI